MDSTNLHINHQTHHQTKDGFEFKMPDLKPNGKMAKLLGFVFLAVLVIFLLILLIKFIFNLPIYSALDHAQSFSPKQINKSVDLSTINNVIELPNDQNGTVGIIKDVNSLAQKKSFFKKARNGDILIIYPNMTIIYDRDNHTVVDISKESLLN